MLEITSPVSGATMFGRASAAFYPSSSRSLYSASSFAATVAAGREEMGLYGFQVLKAAKGFQRFVDEAIEGVGALVSCISLMPPSEDVIKTMDEISNTVCTVIDSAELCSITHPDRK